MDRVEINVEQLAETLAMAPARIAETLREEASRELEMAARDAVGLTIDNSIDSVYTRAERARNILLAVRSIEAHLSLDEEVPS